MIARFPILFLAAALLVSPSLSLTAALSDEQKAQLPPPAGSVDFAQDIKPLLEDRCVKCHGRGKSKGGFKIDTRGDILAGGDSGPGAIAGDSLNSLVIELVSGLDPDNVMPQKGTKLSSQELSLMRAWIDQGLPWEEGFAFIKTDITPLAPRRPAIPAVPADVALDNPIDWILRAYFQTNNIEWPEPVDDRTFARRVFFDAIGLPPSPEELNAFVKDDRPDKRRLLVREVLSRDQEYAEHWMTLWNDMLRNDYRGTGYIDGGRKQITPWLYASLAENKPFDQFVAELINPVPGSEGFIKGIVWRGVVNASQTPEMQAAQNISQVFMGINLKCASCHDSFINDWELNDAYGLASVYSDGPIEVHRCDKPLGETAEVKFLFPELGELDGDAPKEERLKRLAEIMTQERNGRLTRTMANRIWERFFGRGIIEPVDEMDNPPWSADLLDWLAVDLADQGYDLRKMMERIMTSRAYQMPSVGQTQEVEEDYTFQGPHVKRLAAEQYLDALSALTGEWGDLPANQDIDFTLTTEDQEFEMQRTPQWIWRSQNAAEQAPPERVYFRKVVYLPKAPDIALGIVSADNSYTLYVNGKKIRSGKDWNAMDIAGLEEAFQKGVNVIAIEAENGGEGPNPAGLLAHFKLRASRPDRGDQVILDVVTDESWTCSTEKVENWTNAAFEGDENWLHAFELGGLALGPWNVKGPFERTWAIASQYGKVRAALRVSDPLSRALGRPNREQVVTTRSSVATTLQAIELTNGDTLANLLKQGAERLSEETPQNVEEWISRLFTHALSREPSENELALARDMAGGELTASSIENLLWAVSLLPEFQLIY